MSSPPLILDKPKPLLGTTEVTRGFSYKLNPANYDPRLAYESRDFFCSQKAECAIEDAERVSELLYAFCKKEVMKSAAEYLKELKAQKVKRETEQENRRIA